MIGYLNSKRSKHNYGLRKILTEHNFSFVIVGFCVVVLNVFIVLTIKQVWELAI